jgi:hypothetical protein
MRAWRATGLMIGFLALAVPMTALAAKTETSFGLDILSYSGNPTTALTPEIGAGLGFSANIFVTRKFHFAHHFGFSTLLGGASFANTLGPYTGYAGNYEPSAKLVFVSKNALQPYILAGPGLGFYAVTLSSSTATISQSQTALKVGYTIGAGIDWIQGEKRGESDGWGLGITYFSYFDSPAIIDFSAAKLTVKGIALELRRIWGQSK